jgi:serine/threonine-protein kinase RsbW
MELHLPSTLGSEKIAMSAAAIVAEDMGFPEDRIEDLKTAVSEACCNAIEHGNELDESAKVMIVLKVGKSKLQVAVHDEGRDIGKVEKPDIEKKVEGEDEKRGWGMFLIDGLVNEVTCKTKPEGGKVVELMVLLEK